MRAEDGNEIAVLYLPNQDARFTIWFFHGNAEDLASLDPVPSLVRDALIRESRDAVARLGALLAPGGLIYDITGVLAPGESDARI